MGGDRTRVVRLHGGQERDYADNNPTVIEEPIRGKRRHSFYELFCRHYHEIRDACIDFQHSGVAAVAVDTRRDRVAGSLCVAAKAGHANAAIIGRHSMCDLFLDADPAMSLRHMALVVDPVAGYSGGARDVRFRVIDLRTSLAFEDEEARRMEALVAEGPIFIRIGRHALFLLVTGEGSHWPDDANEAWSCIPERVYLEESPAEPDRWKRRRLRNRMERLRNDVDGNGAPESAMEQPEDGASRVPLSDLHERELQHITQVQRVRGPSRARKMLLEEGEAKFGSLTLTTDRAMDTLVLGHCAAQRGILLGRYDRCDSDGARTLRSHNVSRVHLLVVAVCGNLYAIDTASTNGSWIRDDRREIRIQRLDPDTVLTLGDSVADLRWIVDD